MGTVGVLIAFAILGAFICARSRSAGGAVVFSLIALGLFITTPVGSGLPGALTEFMTSVQQASEPLTEGSEAVG